MRVMKWGQMTVRLYGFPADIEAPKREGQVRPRGISAPMYLGCAILGVVFLAALAGPWLVRFSYTTINAGPVLAPPGALHWFGSDAFGRDLFSRVVQGLRVSLWISLAATGITVVPGICLGLLGGYYQGWVDQLLSRLVEVLFALPGLLLAIVLIARLGPSIPTLIVALGITGIPAFYRVTRNETLTLRSQPFIEASLALGLPGIRALFRHILPNIFPSLVVLLSMRVGTFLLMGSGLSFIGLGVQPPEAELGTLLANGKEYYQSAWWLVVFPGACVLLAVLGFNLFGEGLRDRLDLYRGE